MAKSTKTLEERIQEKNLRAQKLMEEAKKVEAQRKLLEKDSRQRNARNEPTH